MIHKGELVKLSRGRAQPRMFFLFDHQLVWCEGKEGSKLFYRGRLETDSCRCEKTEESGKDGEKGAPTYGLSLYNLAKDKWYILRARSQQIRDRWFQAFLVEREQVARDRRDGKPCVELQSFVSQNVSVILAVDLLVIVYLLYALWHCAPGTCVS